ncbi:MAG: hypothetical protein HYY18_01685 [Planctomycetes bacterium]|nr:hypothetical protein [Planctomycetota bacterium]
MHLRTIFAALLAGTVPLASCGCHDYQRRVYVSTDYGHEDEYWDGHAWIVVYDHVHGPGCGHYWHHGYWHLYPEHHIYYHSGYAHYGVYVDFSIAREADSGYVWDGGDWIIVSGHRHGPRCGHYYHHGVWHLHPEQHVYREPYKAPFGQRVREPAPAQREGPRRIRPQPEPRRPDPGRTEPRRPEPRRPEPRKPEPRRPDPRRPEPPGPREPQPEPRAEPGQPPGPGVEPGTPDVPPDPRNPKKPGKPKKPELPQRPEKPK